MQTLLPRFWWCVFEIKILIGLRQAFMAFMRWAIDVPHKQQQGHPAPLDLMSLLIRPPVASKQRDA